MMQFWYARYKASQDNDITIPFCDVTHWNTAWESTQTEASQWSQTQNAHEVHGFHKIMIMTVMKQKLYNIVYYVYGHVEKLIQKRAK